MSIAAAVPEQGFLQKQEKLRLHLRGDAAPSSFLKHKKNIIKGAQSLNLLFTFHFQDEDGIHHEANILGEVKTVHVVFKYLSRSLCCNFLEQSMGARNRVGMRLSYRPAQAT
jgi:hypothetical protein